MFNLDKTVNNNVEQLQHNTRPFTWRSLTKKGRVSSRLDYWLIPSHLLFDTVHTDIEPSIKIDHSLINITLSVKKKDQNVEKGLGKLTTLF